MTVKTGVMLLKIWLCITGINYIKKIKIEMLFYIVMIFHDINLLLDFFFYQINAALRRIRDSFKNINYSKSLTGSV